MNRIAQNGSGRISSSQAAVVIATRDRPDELRKALSSAVAQTAKLEVLVLDDGSTNDATKAVAREFASVRLHRSEQSLGLVVQRNRGATMTDSPIVFSMDDDAVFSSATVVEQTLREFDHPRVGAVAIPFRDVNRSSTVHQRAPQPEGIFATYSYIGTAHALRRDLFLTLGGYREILVHQGEEEDYCTRMLEAGYITRCGTADPIHHFESPRRSWTRMDYFGSRNKVLYAWHNVPFPHAMAHLGAATLRTLAYRLKPDRLGTRARGAMAGYGLVCAGRCERRPVSTAIYRLSRELMRRGAIPLNEVEPLLPPLA